MRNLEEILTRYEWIVFKTLREHEAQVVLKTELEKALSVERFGYQPTSNSLQVFVSRMRRKLPEAFIIKAQRGKGYSLRVLKCDVCDSEPFANKLVAAGGIETRACIKCLINLNPQELSQS